MKVKNKEKIPVLKKSKQIQKKKKTPKSLPLPSKKQKQTEAAKVQKELQKAINKKIEEETKSIAALEGKSFNILSVDKAKK